jgi:hypothetical protein
MATLVHYAAALRYVHIQALLAEESPNGADGLRVALERHLDLLAESCDAFNEDDEYRACRDLHDQCATLLSLLREVAVSRRPANEGAVTPLVTQLLMTIDLYRPLLRMTD